MLDNEGKLPNPASSPDGKAYPLPIAAETLLRSTFDHAPIGMSVVSADGRWLRVNDAFCRALGRDRDAVLAGNCLDLDHPDEVAGDRAFWADVLAGARDVQERDKRYVHADGSALWMHVRSEVVRDEHGAPLYVVNHMFDVPEHGTAEGQGRDRERTLRSMIDNTPSIVYVKGRDHCYELVNREFEEFFGVTGDWVVGRRAEDFLPAGEASVLARKDAAVLAGGAPLQTEETIVVEGRERIFLTTRFPLRDDDGEIVSVCGMSTDVTDRRRAELRRDERLRCSEQIHSAFAQDRFVLHAQPIVNLATGRAEQAELLIRMLAAPGSDELIAPGEFLPGAERFDLIGLIDEWVVDRAIELARNGRVVEVNLSAKTISDPERVERIEQAIVSGGARPRHLIFEITETAASDNFEAAREFALRLRRLGCAFALDDFGVGHGTFTYLRHLPLDYLKIDMQFVRDLLTDVASRHVVQAIVGVAGQFGIATIAEGVEDEPTLKQLRKMGVDYAQGFWTGRPGPLPGPAHAPTDRGEPHAAATG